MERGVATFVAGAERLAGRAIARRLREAGRAVVAGEPDLRDAGAVEAFFAETRPGYVFLAAGRTGGIAANQRLPADLMVDNLLVETHVLRAAFRFGVRKLLYLASACVYPRACPQPMTPAQLFTGPVEPTSEAYAVAKLAGLVLCRAYAAQHGARVVAAIPASVFGPGDETGPEDAHVVGALMRRMHEARRRGDREVRVWGTGRPRRDFLFADDLADACVVLMERYDGPEPINVSAGCDVSIGELAERIQKVVGFEGRLVFDASRPDGAPAKLLDARPLRALGWAPRVSLDEALAATYRAFLAAEAGAAPDA